MTVNRLQLGIAIGILVAVGALTVWQLQPPPRPTEVAASRPAEPAEPPAETPASPREGNRRLAEQFEAATQRSLTELRVAAALRASVGETSPGHTLSRNEAAVLAARLANDECERRYHKRPFASAQHPAILREDGYHWGGLDEAAPGGMSALVTMHPDGSHAKVEVYFSTDILR